MSKKIGCLSSSTLKIIAMVTMLLDHIWGTVAGDQQWLTIVGRIAFPIFAYQIAEGYTKTSNFKKYLGRMLIFAIISEIPFNYMMAGVFFNPFDQNVMVTFLIALLLIRLIDATKKRFLPNGFVWGETSKERVSIISKALLYVGITILICILGYVLGIIGFVDYHGEGVLTVLVFYIFKDIRIKNFNIGPILQFLAVGYIFTEMIQGQCIPGTDIPYQVFGMLAFIPIWLYNGEIGIKGKWFRYLGYAFYPAHILVLVLIQQLIL